MKKLTVVLAVVTLLAGCSSLRVHRDFDVQYDFSKLHFYRIEKQQVHSENGQRVDNSLMESRFAASIDAVLAAKGFSFSKFQPDFIIAYGSYQKVVVDSQPVSTGVGFGFGRYGNYGGVGVSSGSRLEQYDQAILVLDVMDSRTGDLVWRGKGSRRIFTYNDQPEKISREVREVVAEILEKFPPR